MQNLKTFSLAAVATCVALVTSAVRANPLQAVGSAVNQTVSYVTGPFAGYGDPSSTWYCPGQPFLGAPALLGPTGRAGAKPVSPVANTGVNTSSPFYP